MRPPSSSNADRTLVIGCGALARELVALTRDAGLPAIDLSCLPATLHNRPSQIPDGVRERIRRGRAAGYGRVFVAYADCGTGGRLDRVIEEEGVERLEGAHCYEVYAGRAAFAALQDEELGTFYLTDFLARNADRLVIQGLGLDRHPELLPLYFGNYRRLVYLAQTVDPALDRAAERTARRLGLAYERRQVGYGELAGAIATLGAARPVLDPPTDHWPGGHSPSDSTSRGARARTMADPVGGSNGEGGASGRPWGRARSSVESLGGSRAGKSSRANEHSRDAVVDTAMTEATR